MMTVIGLVMRFVGPILGMQAGVQVAQRGDVVQSDWIGHLRLFGRRCRAGVVLQLED